MKRVVVTGMGVVSPLGNKVRAFEEAIFAGRHGIGPITRFDASEFKVKIAAQVKDFDPKEVLEPKVARRTDLFCQYALVAAKEAMDMAAFPEGSLDLDRCGVYVGSGIGGLLTIEEGVRTLDAKGPRRVSPFLIPTMIGNMASGLIAIRYGFAGPTLPIVTACATSTNAIGEAFRAIASGQAEVIAAGGTESSITDLGVAGFTACMALCESNDPDRSSIPFDGDRSGFVIGEGAGVLILEELEHAKARNAVIYAEVTGYGNRCDAHHMTAPDPEARGAASAIRAALAEAGGIDAKTTYYNAHGTSTPLNDKTETLALKKAFGAAAQELAISATKSMTGHMLGAAGAVEAIASILALLANKVPPTIGYRVKDPECDLNYTPNAAASRPLEHAVSASLGFGGHNAVLVLRKYHGR
ncbi:3-oxoacyl-[acyl-carrier-protein] synthase, KASII [Clostridiaceae bacterium JG1575]|nr:3-oxoacyl-[acyl-carrier-protein] synthase, KASII [Clostridiaceae bacterium JG1575]